MARIGPLPGRHEFDVHLALMRRRDRHLEAGGRAALLLQRRVGLRADRRHHVSEHVAVTLAPQFLLELEGRRLDAPDRRQSRLSRRPLRHRQQHHRVVRLHVRKELELHATGEDVPGCDQEHRHRDGHGRVPILEGPPNQGPVGAFDHPLHPTGEEALEAVPTPGDAMPLPVFAPVRQVGQVIRQHQHGLDQRERQTTDDDHGNRPRNGCRGPFHRVDERREGGHGGEDRERDRRRHLARAVDRRAQAPLAHLEVAVDVLAHHDRVVDHDPEHQDEGEQRHHVDRYVDVRQHGERAHERDTDAHRDPQRQPELQEQGQHQKHEQQAQPSALEQDPQPVLQRHRIVEPGRHLEAGRQGRRPLRHEVPDLAGNAQGALVADPVDLDQGHGLTVEA